MDTTYLTELIQELIECNFRLRNASSSKQLELYKQDLEDCKDKLKDELFELFSPSEGE